eukprot:7419540-Pyramimonas_sp.AAC.1
MVETSWTQSGLTCWNRRRRPTSPSLTDWSNILDRRKRKDCFASGHPCETGVARCDHGAPRQPEVGRHERKQAAELQDFAFS